jgi:hypothetical protein
MSHKRSFIAVVKRAMCLCLWVGTMAVVQSSAGQIYLPVPGATKQTNEGYRLAESLGEERKVRQSVREGEPLNAKQALALDAALLRDPSDMEARAKLLGYYFSSASNSLGNEGRIRARRKHILWLIANQPSSKLLFGVSETMIDRKSYELADPQGYAEARKLWLDQTAKKDVTATVLGNAGLFLMGPDIALSSELFGRARKLDPGFPIWTKLQGSALVFALTGFALTTINGPTRVDPELPISSYARRVKTELEASKDVDLLLTVDNELSTKGGIAQMSGSTFDALGFAEFLLDRVEKLPGGGDQSFLRARISLGRIIRAKSPDEVANAARSRYQQLERALSLTHLTDDPDRANQFLELASAALDAGEKNRAVAIANQLIALVPKLREHQANTSIADSIWHHTHLILGRAALRQGDLAGAKSNLLEAGRVNGGTLLSSFGPNMTLAKELLERGEKKVVLEYFELCRKFWKSSDAMNSWIEAVKRGQIPNFGANLLY